MIENKNWWEKNHYDYQSYMQNLKLTFFNYCLHNKKTFQSFSKTNQYKKDSFNEIIDIILKSMKNSFISFIEEKSFIIIGDKGLILLSVGNLYNTCTVGFSYYFFEKEFDLSLFSHLEEEVVYPKVRVRPNNLFVISQTLDGLVINRLDKEIKYDLIRENYEASVLEKYDKAVNELLAKEPNGRILIFQGVPGTGKTYMIRSLLSHFTNIKPVIISADTVENMSSVEMSSFLMNEVGSDIPIVFLLEDADNLLSPRKTEGASNSGITQLLNLGDGLLGSLLDVRIVCSTNVQTEEFDPAIVRPGRLIDLININELPYEQAEKRYRSLGGKYSLPIKEYTIAQLYKRVYEEQPAEAIFQKEKVYSIDELEENICDLATQLEVPFIPYLES